MEHSPGSANVTPGPHPPALAVPFAIGHWRLAIPALPTLDFRPETSDCQVTPDFFRQNGFQVITGVPTLYVNVTYSPGCNGTVASAPVTPLKIVVPFNPTLPVTPDPSMNT